MKNQITFVLCAFLLLSSCDFKKAESKTETKEEVQGTDVSRSTLLNANLASEASLLEAGLSQEVVTQITSQRPFLAIESFVEVLGTSADVDALYAKVFVPLNINETAEETFKLIPGIGDRMAHEFEEYKPYVNLNQFRKEIGKYVDEQEVARLEQYIFVPIELNTAQEEDIKNLPGVGSKMTHEFLEYRPYENMAQFNKEIGKYVDEAELSRLARLVYLQ
ncbi:MAG: hypothetical protein CMC18_09790 [Flavobacteriaceae bacterium]|nr:hypothetical protein [Flavobacteriaceae bacterium]